MCFISWISEKETIYFPTQMTQAKSQIYDGGNNKLTPECLYFTLRYVLNDCCVYFYLGYTKWVK